MLSTQTTDFHNNHQLQKWLFARGILMKCINNKLVQFGSTFQMYPLFFFFFFVLKSLYQCTCDEMWRTSFKYFSFYLFQKIRICFPKWKCFLNKPMKWRTNLLKTIANKIMCKAMKPSIDEFADFLLLLISIQLPSNVL